MSFAEPLSSWDSSPNLGPVASDPNSEGNRRRVSADALALEERHSVAAHEDGPAFVAATRVAPHRSICLCAITTWDRKNRHGNYDEASPELRQGVLTDMRLGIQHQHIYPASR